MRGRIKITQKIERVTIILNQLRVIDQQNHKEREIQF